MAFEDLRISAGRISKQLSKLLLEPPESPPELKALRGLPEEVRRPSKDVLDLTGWVILDSGQDITKDFTAEKGYSAEVIDITDLLPLPGEPEEVLIYNYEVETGENVIAFPTVASAGESTAPPVSKPKSVDLKVYDQEAPQQ